MDESNKERGAKGFVRADLKESACMIAGGVVGGGLGLALGLTGASLVATTVIGAFLGKLAMRLVR